MDDLDIKNALRPADEPGQSRFSFTRPGVALGFFIFKRVFQ
jgi:hypothetical protein